MSFELLAFIFSDCNVWMLGFRRAQLQDFREDLKSLQKLRLLDVSQNSISIIPEVLIVKPIHVSSLEVTIFANF